MVGCFLAAVVESAVVVPGVSLMNAPVLDALLAFEVVALGMIVVVGPVAVFGVPELVGGSHLIFETCVLSM